MSKLTRFVKKARKLTHLPALTIGNAAKVGAIVGSGGVGALGGAVLASKLKSVAVGGLKQTIKSKAAKAIAKRGIVLTPTKGAATATTMPGGAPLKGKTSQKGRGLTKFTKRTKAAAKATVKRAKKAARKAVKAPSGKKRQAPKGGKDFKALSASWKAAGKPGTWLAWVKGH